MVLMYVVQNSWWLLIHFIQPGLLLLETLEVQNDTNMINHNSPEHVIQITTCADVKAKMTLIA